jgi:hypothetical protein
VTASPTPSTFTIAPGSGRSLIASIATPLMPLLWAGGGDGVGLVGGPGVDDPEPHATDIVQARTAASLPIVIELSGMPAGNGINLNRRQQAVLME